MLWGLPYHWPLQHISYQKCSRWPDIVVYAIRIVSGQTSTTRTTDGWHCGCWRLSVDAAAGWNDVHIKSCWHVQEYQSSHITMMTACKMSAYATRWYSSNVTAAIQIAEKAGGQMMTDTVHHQQRGAAGVLTAWARLKADDMNLHPCHCVLAV